jgi:hypothetical protein
METKEKTFDNVSDNFKKICTENGINQDALVEFIINSISLLPDDEKLNFLNYLIVEEVLMCTDNIYEALGVLALSKTRYLDIMRMDFDDEDDEDDE